MQTSEDIQFKKMTQTPVKSLILKLAIPTIISMLVTSLYNMADTYFVSQLGKSASGAVGVVFSLMAIIQAVGFTLGMGSGSIISRALGRKDYEYSNKICSSAFFTSIFLGCIITLFGLFFIEPFMKCLGATDTVLPYARQYAVYILLGAPIMAGSFVLNNNLRAIGEATLSMIGLGIGGILNIGLDPLFIFVFDLGIAGAAIATLISQIISFLILLISTLFCQRVIKMKLKNISLLFADYSEIVKTGLPSFCRQGFASVATILLNNQAGAYGSDAALSAMSIVSKIFMMIFCVLLGIGQGYQPVMGFNYGAKKCKRCEEAFVFFVTRCSMIMLLLSIAAFTFAPKIIPMFIKDEDVIAIGVNALRFQAISLPFLTINVACNMTFQSIGKKLKAVLLSCCRQGFFFVPCILVLPSLFELLGVELTQMISDLCTSLVSIPFAYKFYKEIKLMK